MKIFFCLLLWFPLMSFSQTKTQNKPSKNSVKLEKYLKGPKLKEVPVIILHTSEGKITLTLYRATPGHARNFIKLIDEKFYEGTTFHRVIPSFMIQGGDPNSKDNDPNNDGQGGPGYTIPAEIIDSLSHIRGALAAARMGDQVNPKKESSGSQFYIVQNPKGTPHLNGNYSVYGRVLDGMDIVDVIALKPRNNRDRPDKDIKIVKTELIWLKLKDAQKQFNYVW